jgi:hypothetical protein
MSAKKSIDFNNKYLLYSKTAKDETKFWADFFIINEDSSRVEQTVYPFGNRYSIYSNGKNLMIPNAADKFKIEKRKDGIYYVVDYEGQKRSQRRYSLKSNDTNWIKDNFFKNRLQISRSVFTGRDTIINFYNNPIECWKYIEWNRFPGNDTYIEKYVDKNYYLPILINKTITYYAGRVIDANFKDTTYSQSYILRIVLDKNEVKTKEWRNQDDPFPE